MQLKRLAPTYTWQTGSRTIFQDIVSGSRYLFYAPVVVVVAVSLEIRLIEFRYLCTSIMESFSPSSSFFERTYFIKRTYNRIRLTKLNGISRRTVRVHLYIPLFATNIYSCCLGVHTIFWTSFLMSHVGGTVVLVYIVNLF